VAVVCDNVIVHRSKLVQRWLAAHPRLLVLHGARYSPHDNPVERIWGALKAWLANNPTLTSRAVCAKSTPSSATGLQRRCWRPLRRAAHPGCPRVTDKTSGRPLRRSLPAGPYRVPTQSAVSAANAASQSVGGAPGWL
jgi:hypothetical protein